ncbi:hypothetical protein TNCV_2578461 [Trichonephila clavipes]|nr:hypothetical protein TNCV_2578461 [Trichonephila clavipes]
MSRRPPRKKLGCADHSLRTAGVEDYKELRQIGYRPRRQNYMVRRLQPSCSFESVFCALFMFFENGIYPVKGLIDVY